MQTFLPYADFEKSAKCLDYRRLGKQRVEALQIYNIVSGKRTTGGWINHPAVKMWRGYSELLACYHNVMIQEWVNRGYNNNMQVIPEHDWFIKKYPSWLGNNKLHSSHRSNLLRKDYNHYSQFGWTEPSDLNYYWING
tara:strand:+ start:430 stop:843 length:414 start_codon:yes stop_codon:yes gene_type:complete